MNPSSIPPGFQDMLSFGLMEALLGRRSRRFFRGAEIPDGVFKFTSRHESVPLSAFEKMLIVSACGGNTSWHNMIYRGENYAPHLSNYAGAAGGRVFPSAAGFHTSRTFFTDGRWCLYARHAGCTGLFGPDTGRYDGSGRVRGQCPSAGPKNSGWPAQDPFGNADHRGSQYVGV